MVKLWSRPGCGVGWCRAVGLGLLLPLLGPLRVEAGLAANDDLAQADGLLKLMVEPIAFSPDDASLAVLPDVAFSPLSAAALSLDNLPDIAALEANTAASLHEASAAPPQAIAQSTPPPPDPSESLDLAPEVIEASPVLQRWLQGGADVLADIAHDPSFRTRIRLGYAHVPSDDRESGMSLGIEDVLVGETRMTLSADYQASFGGDRQSYGADVRYYLRPLGRTVNLAPVLGYRRLETPEYSTDGVNVGVRLFLALSRTGAADISLAQTWVNPGSQASEVGLTTLSFGYALTRDLRLSTELQQQNSTARGDRRLGLNLEWML